MTYKTLPQRRSIRLEHYDYAQAGAYHVILSTAEKEHLFGKIVQGKMILNSLGEMLMEHWLHTPRVRSNVELDEFVIMPDHLHGIVVILDEQGGEDERIDRKEINGDATNINVKPGICKYTPTTKTRASKLRSPSRTLGAMVRGFKAAVTTDINRHRDTPHEAVWQRNYYEHIVRNQKDLENIRQYIINNPANWENE